MNEKDKDKIWIPNIVFSNSPDKIYTKVDSLSALNVIRRGNMLRKFNFEQNEFEEFQGNENPIIFENIYFLKLTCKFDLHYYPFDTQTCLITVSNFLSFDSLTTYLLKIYEARAIRYEKVDQFSSEFIHSIFILFSRLNPSIETKPAYDESMLTFITQELGTFNSLSIGQIWPIKKTKRW